ncbi:DNA repair protein RadC [Flavobacteriaceae bacterium]|nr:DNA repair protein RadC [Flavobacteriaceae bacterium]
MKKNFSIKNWSEEDRPREKLLSKGKESLTDSELLAILIGSGNRNESAVALCKRLLSNVDNNLHALGKLSISKLKEFKGIGEAKAISIIACLELGRRRREANKSVLEKVSSSKSVFEIMQPLLGDLQHEEFWVLFLNNSNVILSKQQLSKGGITGTLVDIRLLMKKTLEIGAIAIIVCHNHPSGTLLISEADKNITTKIKTACTTLDVKLLDHLIITEQSYVSFADKLLI